MREGRAAGPGPGNDAGHSPPGGLPGTRPRSATDLRGTTIGPLRSEERLILCSRPLGPDRADPQRSISCSRRSRVPRRRRASRCSPATRSTSRLCRGFAAIYAIVPRYEQQMARSESAGERTLPEAGRTPCDPSRHRPSPGISTGEYDEIRQPECARTPNALSAAVVRRSEERFAAPARADSAKPPARAVYQGTDHAAPCWPPRERRASHFADAHREPARTKPSKVHVGRHVGVIVS